MTQRNAPSGFGYLPALDGLRAFALILVVGYHLAPRSVPGGFLGVNIFFTLSGFLITRLLIDEWQRTGAIALRLFYARRLLRLMPALIVAVVAAAPVYWATGSGSEYPAAAASALTYTYDAFQSLGSPRLGALTPTWSLSVEEQFYLLWAPIIAVLVLRRWPLGRFAAAGVIIAVVVRAGLETSSTRSMFFSPTTYVDQLMIGALLSVATADGRNRITGACRPVWVGAAACLAFVIASVVAPAYDAQAYYLGGLTCVAITAGALVGHLAVSPTSRVTRAFASPGMAWLGKRSYGIYLFHYVIIEAARPLIASGLIRAAGVVPVTVIIAAASYAKIERPISDRRRHFRARSITERAVPAPETAPSLG